jgi:putative ABC transport system ATP-binding protein
VLERVHLASHARHRPNELSGGQRQRVAIARALVTRPRIILADEPTANLDSKTGEGILALMKDINRDQGTTFVFSTHDKKEIAKADRLVRIADGRIHKLGVRSALSWVVVRAQDQPSTTTRRRRASR